MRKHGPWLIHRTREVYSDPWIEVTRDEVTRPDGAPGSYATVRIKRGVCVIAVDEARTVYLTKEFHYAVGRTTVEGVSGGIEDAESSRVAAERELAEELGWRAARWTYLGQIDPFTSSVCSTVDLYLAEELQACDAAPEGTELIEPVSMPLSAAVALIGSEITHGPTCTALLIVALQQLRQASGPQQPEDSIDA